MSTGTRELSLMQFQVEIAQNHRKKIFRDKQKNKKDIIDVFNCPCRFGKLNIAFFGLLPTNKEDLVYVFSIYKPQNKQ